MLKFFNDYSNDKIKKYAIHLMWIMKEKDEELPFISAHQERDLFATKILEPAIKWAHANPKATIFFWYDGQLVTEQALNNTQNLLDGLLKTTEISNVALSDIRTLPVVQTNPDIFTAQIPVYFRVDLLKLIFLVHSIEADENNAAIFSDIEVGDFREKKDRMSYNELFDQKTTKMLLDVGFVMNGRRKIENQFLSLYNNPVMLDTIKLIINSNMARAVFFLNEERDYIANIKEVVFSTMKTDIMPFYMAAINGVSVDLNFNKNEYSAWGYSVNPAGYVDNTINYRLVETIPEEKKLRLPYRNTVLECRGGNGHSRDINLPNIPPATGHRYQCSYLSYKTDEVRRVLGMLPMLPILNS